MKRSLTFLLLGLTFSVTPVYGAPLPAFPLVDGSRLNVLAFTLGFVVLLIFFLRKARAGEALYLRRIAGLDAIEEAIGRATEMGKPIYFVNGLDPPSTISTLAAINILGLVAQKVAEYETPLRVPNVDPLTFAIEKEVVRNAYVSAGKGDAYDPDTVYFIAGSQFAYAAAVSGSMVREKPATNIILGYFYAESLIFAETGAATGAVQIAGTDAVTQLPFFVAACDYTLIGEELYAASAYLTREPLLLGALKAQDAGKLLAGATLLFSSAYTFVMSAFAPGSPLKDLVLNILKTG